MEYDLCVHVRNRGGKIVIVAIYVDDLIIVSIDEAPKNKLKKHLSNHFRMKNLGTAKHCDEIPIEKTNDDGIIMDQKAYVETVWKRCNMSECTCPSKFR